MKKAVLVKNSSQTIYISGQLGIDPKSGNLVTCGGIQAEFRQIMENVKNILDEAGATLSHVVKINCYMADLEEFQTMNHVYQEYLNESKPARTTFQVGRLPLNARFVIFFLKKIKTLS